jgi:hypothetical protein
MAWPLRLPERLAVKRVQGTIVALEKGETEPIPANNALKLQVRNGDPGVKSPVTGLPRQP